MEDGIFDTDFKKANDYFAQAAERGNAIAMVNLAISYQVGRDVEKDMRKALDLYTSAAQAGEKYAAREAARIYLTGEENVIDVNYDKAIDILIESKKRRNWVWHLIKKIVIQPMCVEGYLLF